MTFAKSPLTTTPTISTTNKKNSTELHKTNPTMIKAVIIEDEANGVKNLKNLLGRYCPDVEVVATADSVATSIKLLENPDTQPDVAFLDINLSDGLVFQMLNQIRGKVKFDIIFVTAHEKFAVRACQYSSIGYIIKPIDPDELREAVNRIRVGEEGQIRKRLEVFNSHYNNNKNHPNAFEKISISATDGIHFRSIRNIVRCEAEDNYTHIYFSNGEKITASKTIKFFQEMLSNFNFYRVHKSHLINLNYMRQYVKGDGGYLIMDDNKQIEVSRRRRPAFMVAVNGLQSGMM